MLANMKHNFLLENLLDVVGYMTGSPLLVAQEETKTGVISMNAYKNYNSICNVLQKDVFMLGLGLCYCDILKDNIAVPAIKIIDKDGNNYYFTLS